MAPRGTTRTASAKVEEPKVNGVVKVTKTAGMSAAFESPIPYLIISEVLARGRTKKSGTTEPNGVEPPKIKTANGMSTARQLNESHVNTTLPGAGRSRTGKSATPAPVDKPAKKAAEKPAEKPTTKRKKTEEPEDAPHPKPKKTKTKAEKAEDKKPKPKGPVRYRGNKVEINPLRYTEPLKVFVFGEGSSGELGFGATKKAIDVKRPRYNEPLSNQNVVRIATGGMHVVALTQDNKILTWGVNDNGALGRDTSNANVVMKDIDEAAGSDSDSEDDPTGGLNDKEATPTAISDEYFPEGTVFVDVVAGDSCSFALTTEGAVYGWGTFRVSLLITVFN